MSRAAAPLRRDCETSRTSCRSLRRTRLTQPQRGSALLAADSSARSFFSCRALRLCPATLVQLLLCSLLIFAATCNGEPHPRAWGGEAYLNRPVKDGIARRQTSSAPAPNPAPTVLRNFQVTAPVFAPADDACTQTLMVHSFANSFGIPFVGPYTPPSCDFNRVIMNLTVTSQGLQFDRLGMMWFNDTEVFLTSTSEPTTNGIIWEYTKDMTTFLSLWKQPSTLIFDIDNIVDDTDTGVYNATLTATFFKEDNAPPAADVIVPISARLGSQGKSSIFMIPPQTALNNVTLPQNIKKAIFSISSCGQANEEFWWSNVPNDTVNTFTGTELFGFSPWRELQLLIDGSLAGVAWPFPVIFTGGVVPGFWRPVAGIDAYDLMDDEIDISPFIPQIADGKSHSFEIRVAGIASDGTTVTVPVGDNWLVTGKIFLFTDEGGAVTTGSMQTQSVPAPQFHVDSRVTLEPNSTRVANATLDYTVLAQRNIEFVSTIKTSEGEQQVSWKQSLSFSNMGFLSGDGNQELNSQETSGTHTSSFGYTRQYSYPLTVNSTFSEERGTLSIVGTMDRSKNVQVTGRLAFTTPIDALPPAPGTNSPPDFAGYAIRNRQNGSATLFESTNASSSSSFTEQQYALFGEQSSNAAPGPELFTWHTVQQNAVVIVNDQSPVMDDGVSNGSPAGAGPDDQVAMQDFAVEAVTKMLGRGPKEGD